MLTGSHSAGSKRSDAAPDGAITDAANPDLGKKNNPLRLDSCSAKSQFTSLSRKVCDVIRARLVLVVEVVGVLPHIHGEQRLLAMGHRQVGIAGLRDFQLTAFEHQPGPAAAELRGAGLLEPFAELVVAAEVRSRSYRRGSPV